MITASQALFFDPLPGAFPLWAALEAEITLRWPDTVIDVQKTQISLRCPKLFGCVSLPRRKKDGTAIVLTVGLSHPIESPRLIASCEVRPGSWTHHLLIASEANIQAEAVPLLEESRTRCLSSKKK